MPQRSDEFYIIKLFNIKLFGTKRFNRGGESKVSSGFLKNLLDFAIQNLPPKKGGQQTIFH